MATIKTSSSALASYVMFEQESTFGTALTDGSNYIILDMIGNEAPGFVPDQFLDDNIRNQGKNIIDTNDYYMTENGMWQRYTLPDIIAPADVLANFLYGVCQTVSEAIGDPYVKTYTLDGTTDPDFSSDAGWFGTFLIKEPFASFSKKLTSCIFESLTVRFNSDNGGRCSLTGTVLTGKGYTGTSDPDGTNAHSTVGIPSFHDSTASTLTIGGTDMVYYSIEYVITNVIDYVGHSSGNAENYKVVTQNVMANAVLKYDTATDTIGNLKGQDLGGAFIHTIGASGADPYFKFTNNDPFLRDISFDRGGTDTVQKVNLVVDMPNDYTNTQYSVFECADGVDQTW